MTDFAIGAPCRILERLIDEATLGEAQGLEIETPTCKCVCKIVGMARKLHGSGFITLQGFQCFALVLHQAGVGSLAARARQSGSVAAEQTPTQRKGKGGNGGGFRMWGFGEGTGMSALLQIQEVLGPKISHLRL